MKSTLSADCFARFYHNVMSDNGTLSDNQSQIEAEVTNLYNLYSRNKQCNNVISVQDVLALLDKLNANCAPGIDGITAEHLKFGKSDMLCNVLSNLFTTIMSWQIVPTSFQTGVIIPILKKPGLNPNSPSSYRPVTLSTTFSKMVELLILPEDKFCNTQFGFHKGMGTSFACNL